MPYYQNSETLTRFDNLYNICVGRNRETAQAGLYVRYADHMIAWKGVSVFREEKGMKGRRKGFTLVELMIVIVIMTILAAAATPIFSGYVKKAKATEHLAECRAIYVAAQSYLEELRVISSGEITLDDINSDDMLREIRALTSLENVGEGANEPGSGTLVEDYYVYLENTNTGVACTAVVYNDHENGIWIFDVVEGTYLEMN